jgi:hypothetical protein
MMFLNLYSRYSDLLNVFSFILPESIFFLKRMILCECTVVKCPRLLAIVEGEVTKIWVEGR